MKHLKTYNESISDVTDLKEIEELFYPISDEYINVFVRRDLSQIIRFDKPIMYFHEMRHPANFMCQLDPKVHHLGSKQTINVIITKSDMTGGSLSNKPVNKMDITPLVDDLRFAIEYLKKEKGLNLKQIFAGRQELYASNYPSSLYYKDLDHLMNDETTRKSILSLVLYFGD